MPKRPPLKDTNDTQGLINLGSIPGQAPVASFNIAGIENLLRTKGFSAWHYKHALNPDREALNAPADPNTQASFRGLRYYDPRMVAHVPREYKMEDLLAALAIYERGSNFFNVSVFPTSILFKSIFSSISSLVSELPITFISFLISLLSFSPT